MKVKKIIFLFVILLCVAFTNSQVLVSVSTDKTELLENEMGWLIVKVYNDSPKEIPNVYLKIETDEGLSIIKWNEETNTIIEETGKIREYFSKEYKYKIRLTKNTGKKINIIAKFGLDSTLGNLSGTHINPKNNGVSTKITVKNKNSSHGENIIIEFNINNQSGKTIRNILVQPKMPIEFTQTAPQFLEKLEDKNQAILKFESIAPPKIFGQKKVIVSYGYFDENTPHYFEKEVEISYQRNAVLLLVIGLIVLVIAVYLYLKKIEQEEKDKKEAKKFEK